MPNESLRTSRRKSIVWIAAIALMAAALAAYLYRYISTNPQRADQAANELRILAYSSFTSTWGPGPEIARMFEEKHPGTKVILLQAEDAGLLLAKLQSFPADVVLGFDQLGKRLAEKKASWRPHGVDLKRALYSDEKFVSFDWAPLGFLYRDGEIDPPKDFQDLLSSRFQGVISLQDPRSSSPGFQFVNWLVSELGEDQAFDFLRKLKPNVHSMSGSWSQSYGLFTRGLSKLTFGYATSVLYHRLSEKDDRYRFVTFPVQHPVQIEYAAIVDKCQSCDLARGFLEFLLEPDVQKVLMNKNWMLPIDPEVARDTPFAELMQDIRGEMKVDDPEAMLVRWRKEVL